MTINRTLRAEIARLKAEVQEFSGDFCPHKKQPIWLVFETDGSLRTSNLKPCRNCQLARSVHSISFLSGIDNLESASKPRRGRSLKKGLTPVSVPNEWLLTFNKANSGGVKIYGTVDPDLI